MGRLGLRTGGLWAGAVAVVLGISALCHPAYAQNQKEKRLALVIGQSGYQHVPKLPNPINDANAIAEKFKSAGFEVDVRRDLSNIEMRRAMREFTAATRTADIAVVYFAGHGFEVSGNNYLIPVDAKLQNDLDVDDESLALDRVVKALEPAKRLRLIILDACRDNPFLKTMTRTIASRQVTNGLAKVEPDTDTLIAFAAKAGSTADDGVGKHSPFTVALLNNLFEPGTDIRIALGRVRDEVKRATGNKQEPFVYGSLGGNTVSLVPAPETKPAPAVAAPAVDPHANIRRDYELAAQIGTKEVWDSFLETYKTGFFADLAKAARSKIIAAEKAEAAANEQKAKAEAAEKARAANAAAERAKAEAAKLAAEAAERARAEAAEKARAEAARQQEQARKAEEARQAEEARKAELARKAEEAIRAKEARRAQEAQAKEAQQGADIEKKLQIAALPASSNEPDVTRSLQTELRRVGCHLGSIDGKWNPSSQRSLESFNRYSGMKLEVAAASADALDAVKAKTSRICPLTCERGFKAEGERCVAITCPSGQFLNSGGSCEARPKKTVSKPEPPARQQREVQREAPARRINDIPCDRGLGPWSAQNKNGAC